jgi:hemoglobin-like flavoprotein
MEPSTAETSTTGSQQQALAGSVAAFATGLLASNSAPEKLMSRIAHKHASLGIKPEQYQVVHDELMGAIVDILGDAVTPISTEVVTRAVFTRGLHLPREAHSR